jgi:hypothetical protein
MMMTADQFDADFDQGQYEQEYSAYLAEHYDANATKLAYLAESFASYEDFRDSMLVSA